jgi:spore coat protein CotH
MKTTLLLAALLSCARIASADTAPKSAVDLFGTTNVWTAHLRFTPDQWQAMEPKRSGGGGFNFRPPGGGSGEQKDGRDSMLQGADGKRNGLSSAIGFEFAYVHADLEFAGITFTNVAVRYKGNGTYMESQSGVKRPLKVDLNKFVKGQKLAGVTTLDFQNNTTDAGMMNDTLAYRFFRDAGVPAPRTAYAKVYVDVPGVYTNRYFGLYTMPENVDGHFAKERFKTKDGLIMKPVTSRPFTDLGDDWAKYDNAYDPKTKATAAQKQRVIAFAQFVSHATDADFAKRLGEFLDVDGFARFLAATVWLSNFDSLLDMGQNYYVYLDPSSNMLSFIPWDLDHSWGTFGLKGMQEQREQLSIAHPWTGPNRFLERMFAVEDFNRRYRVQLTEINRTLGQPERLQKQVDEIAAATRDAVKEEGEEQSKRFEQSVAGKAPEAPANRGGFGGRPGMFASSKPIKAFVTVRHASVADQLAGKSKGQEVQDQMFGGRGGRGGAGGGPGGPGGPGGFGPGNFLAAPLLALADTDKDGKVSAKEFHALGEKWFTTWDTNKTSELNHSQITRGLNLSFPVPPGFGPPGGGGGDGFGPGMFVGPGLIAAMDADKNKAVTKADFLGAFDRWITTWDPERKGFLDEDRIRAGINKDWVAPGGFGLGGPGGPGGPSLEGR